MSHPAPRPRSRPIATAARIVRILAAPAVLLAVCSSFHAAPAAAQVGRTTLAGHVGGRFGDVVLVDGRIWLATGPRIVALDPGALADGRPVAASELLPGMVRDLVVDGTRAVLAGDGFGLAVIDLAPEAGPPRLLGRAAIGFDGRGVAVQEDRAVVAAADGNVVVFDLVMPALPRRLGAVALTRPELGELRPDRVVLRGDRAWVTLVPARAGLPGAAFQAVDLSTPARPTALGRLETPGVTGAMALAGDFVLVAETGVGLRIVDVAADPPATRGVLPPGALGGGVASGVAVAGERAWLVGRDTSTNVGAPTMGHAWTIDITDPGAPVVAGSIALPHPAARAAVAGDLLVVAQPDGALTALVVAAGTALVERASYIAPATVGAAVVVPDAAGERSIAWLAAGAGGVWSVDLDAGGGPTPLARLMTSGQVVDVAARDGLVYAVTADPSFLLVIDAQDPAQPQLVAMLPGQGRPARVSAPAGTSMVLIADIDEGLQFVDAANPSQPRLNLALRRAGFAWDVAVEGGRALVAAGNTGLAVLDLSLFERPVVASAVPSFGSVYGVAFAGRHGLAATLDGGLAIVDLVEPYRAGEVGRFRGGQAVDVAALGGFAYVAMADAGVRVVDVRSPARPLLAEDIPLPGWTGSVEAAGDGAATSGRVLASAREAGLYAFDVDAPPLPTATPGPSITPFQTPIPTPLPTRPARPSATLPPQDLYLPVAMADLTAKPRALPARLVAQLPAAALGNGELLALAAAGARAWVAAGDAEGGAVIAIDLGAPAAPRVAGRADLPAWPHDLALAGDQLYAALWRQGIQRLDVSGAAPRNVGMLSPTLWPLRLAAAPERILAAGAVPDDPGRLRLAVVGSTAPPVAGAFGRLALDAAGGRALVADEAYGLRTYAIGADGALSDAGALAQVGAVDVALAASAPAHVALLYRGDGVRVGGLLLVDPALPTRRIGAWAADDPSRGLELRRVALDADGRCAWLTDRDTLMAVDLAAPERPSAAGRLPLVARVPGLARGELVGLAVMPRHVVVLDRRAGLFVLERAENVGGCGARPLAGLP